jgi:hypothetical protein
MHGLNRQVELRKREAERFMEAAGNLHEYFQTSNFTFALSLWVLLRLQQP